jgi:hypothetical protein
MNRQKKIKQTLKKITKRLNAKKQPKKKSTYICKAERARLQAKEHSANEQPPEIIKNGIVGNH